MKKLFLLMGIMVSLAMFAIDAGAIISQASTLADNVSEKIIPPAGYPKKDISVVVTTLPGGGTDATARAFLKVAEKYTDVQFIIQNIPGGNGWTGYRECLAADADGYKLVCLLTNVFSDSGSDYSWENFIPLTNMTAYPRTFVTTPESDLQTLDDVIKKSKESPGSIRVAIDAFGGIDHLASQKFEKLADIQLTYVPFASFAEDAAALLGGNVELTCGGLPDYSSRGDLIPLTIWGEERAELWPNVPTMKELGYDISILSFRGLGAEKGTPPEICDYLEKVFAKTAADPEWLEIANTTDLWPRYLNRTDFSALMENTFKVAYADYFEK